MAGEVRLTTSLSRPNAPVTGEQQVVYALLEVMPTEAVSEVKMPVNVSLILDRSGSMRGEKIQRVKDAVGLVVDRLSDGDCLSVVTFSNRTSTMFGSRQLQSLADRDQIKKQVGKLMASGGTRMAPAIRAGLEEVKKRWSPTFINRLVLLTDGRTEKERDCLEEADGAGIEQVSILALGVGTDWNEDLLIEIGAKSGGQADYIADAHEIGQYFESAVASMQSAVVHDTSLTFRLASGVQPRRVGRVVPLISDLGYGPIDDRFVSLPLGELQKDCGQVLLVELVLPARQAGTFRVAQAEIAYDVPLHSRMQEKVRADILIEFTDDPAAAQHTDPHVMSIVEKVHAFDLQTRALQEVEAGDLGGATRKLRAAATILLDQGEAELAQTMKLEADKLEEQGQMTSGGRKTIKFESGKTVRLDRP